MNCRRLSILGMLVILAALFCGCAGVRPPLYSDPAYETRQIEEINVIGTLDARADTTVTGADKNLIFDLFGRVVYSKDKFDSLKQKELQQNHLDLLKKFTTSSRWVLQKKKNYDVRYCQSWSFAAAFTHVKKMIKGENLIPDTTEAFISSQMTVTDLTDKRTEWLASLPPAVGRWVCVMVIHTLKIHMDEVKITVSGFLFDREAGKLIWNDIAASKGYVVRGMDTKDFVQQSELLSSTIQFSMSNLMKSLPKKGKRFVPPKQD
jgi:hypothetical protein